MLKRLPFLILLLMLLIPTPSALCQDLATSKGEIISVLDGQAIRGIVPIEGNTKIEGFLAWEISYGYSTDTTGTWFLLAESFEPVENNLLTNWETIKISDGDYNLRLTIFLEQDEPVHTFVQNVRIRNYTPMETDTAQPTITQPIYTDTPPTGQNQFETPLAPSLTPLPTNALELPPETITSNILRGGAGVMVIFITIGLYSTVKKSLQK